MKKTNTQKKKRTYKITKKIKVKSLRIQMIVGMVILELLENTKMRERMMNILKAKDVIEKKWVKKQLSILMDEIDGGGI